MLATDPFWKAMDAMGTNSWYRNASGLRRSVAKCGLAHADAGKDRSESLSFSEQSRLTIRDMKTTVKNLLILALSAFTPAFCDAQCTTNGATACSQGVPRFVKFNGTLKRCV